MVVPPLHIRLFGGMEVTIDGEVLDPRLFTKQKAKTLLAILALNLGREVPRQTILDSMWPNLVGDAPINNFYSMWSVLRKVLSLPDGSCPYLVRHQGSCMLDARYVTCDVTDVDALCHAMLFNDLETREWIQTSAKLEEAYAGELLPSEIKNEYIIRMREIYHQRLIDALVSASHRTSSLGDAKLGLWFARAALGYEQSREDVYRVLMEAQALSGQRTEAVETFMSCLKRMRDDYGVDLSPEMMELYEGLVLNREQVSFT